MDKEAFEKLLEYVSTLAERVRELEAWKKAHQVKDDLDHVRLEGLWDYHVQVQSRLNDPKLMDKIMEKISIK